MRSFGNRGNRYAVKKPERTLRGQCSHLGMNRGSYNRNGEEGLSLRDSARKGNDKTGTSYSSLVLLFVCSFWFVSVKN